jgi:hypothetical protein
MCLFHKWYNYNIKRWGVQSFWKRCLKCRKVKFVASRRCNHTGPPVFSPKDIDKEIASVHLFEDEKLIYVAECKETSK